MPEATETTEVGNALANLTATRLPELSQPAYETVNHPLYYGGQDDPYEAIKVIEAWDLGFNLGNAVKYIRRAGHKPGSPYLLDLEKALSYLQHEIDREKAR